MNLQNLLNQQKTMFKKGVIMKQKIKHKEITKVKNHILKVAPKISYIDIQVQNHKNGTYKSQIYVHIPNKKSIVSTKEDQSLSHSLWKAHNAALKQIKKTIKPKVIRKSIRRYEHEFAA